MRTASQKSGCNLLEQRSPCLAFTTVFYSTLSQRLRAHWNLSGHGGQYCSEYISQALPLEIAGNFEKYPGKSIPDILEKSFVNVDNSITGTLQESFKSSISWTKTKARKQKAVDDLLEQSTLVDVVLRARAGSTALVTAIGPKYIHVANVGDCRAGKNIINKTITRRSPLTTILCDTIYYSLRPN